MDIFYRTLMMRIRLFYIISLLFIAVCMIRLISIPNFYGCHIKTVNKLSEEEGISGRKEIWEGHEFEKNSLTGTDIESLANSFVKQGKVEPFIAESVSDRKDSTVPLACVSEPSLTSCYEYGGIGFASFIIVTLDHLRLCHKNNGIPTVHWRSCFSVCQPDTNIDSFSHYFEPLNDGVENKAKTVLCLGNPLQTYDKNDNKSGKVPYRKRKFRPVLDFSFRPRLGLKDEGYFSENLITDEIRHEMSFIIKKYLKVKSFIMAKVEAVYSTHMKGKNILAIHVRGTDHWTESSHHKLTPLKRWLYQADKILKQIPEPKNIFLATDNEETVTRFTSYYGQQKDAYRATKYNDDPEHGDRKDPFKIGEQVLMDILLMARCDYFLHGESNVASLTSYFNQNIKSFFVDDEIGRDKKHGKKIKVVKKSLQRRLKTTAEDDEKEEKEETEDKDEDHNDDKEREEDADENEEETDEDVKYEDVKDMKEKIRCWLKNRDVSACPSMKTGNYIKVSELENYF